MRKIKQMTNMKSDWNERVIRRCKRARRTWFDQDAASQRDDMGERGVLAQDHVQQNVLGLLLFNGPFRDWKSTNQKIQDTLIVSGAAQNSL